jgi:hypothetical protein
MDESMIYPIILVVLFGGACLVAALILSGMGVFLYRFVRRNNQVFQAADQELAVDKGTYLTDASAQILPWEPTVLSDFSSHLAITGRRVLANLHYRGSIHSLNQPKEHRWLAFDLQLKRARGPMEMHTDNANYQLDIALNAAEVRVDGQSLGSLKTRSSEIYLIGVDERPLGRYQRPSRRVSLHLGPNPDFFKPIYGSIVIRERPIAKLNNNMILSQHLKYTEEPIPPLFQNLATDLNGEETDWLLALLAMEIYFRIERHLREKTKKYR